MIPGVRTLVALCLFSIILIGCEKKDSDSESDGRADFVALRSNETNARAGPGKNFPIICVYKLRHMPLKVMGRYDRWLKVVDMDGDVGWINEGLTIKLRTVVTIGASQFLYHNFSAMSYPTHRVERNVVGKLLGCRKDRCKVKIGKIKGWLNKSDLWGHDG
jgi:SH3-like domain-containing protein